MSEYEISNVDVLVSTASVSIPFYFLTIPEGESLAGEFVYNYYTRNEGVSEVVSLDAVDDESDQYDFIVENWEKGVYPRQINLSFTMPVEYTKETLRSGVVSSALSNGKIIYEDAPFTNRFTGVIVHDTAIDEKVYKRNSGIEDSEEVDSITSDFLNISKLQASGYGFSKSRATEKTVNLYEIDVKAVNLGISLNDAVVADVLNTVQRWQSSAFADEFAYAASQTQSIQDGARAEILSNPFTVTEDEIDTGLTAIETIPGGGPEDTITTHVGYIIEKYGEQIDGSTLRYSDIVIEDPNETAYTDTVVRYGSVYKYRIRAIYKKGFPVAVITPAGIPVNIVASVLFASSGVQTIVQCVETTPPSPPNNISFNQTQSGLYISWNFPINKQKDIKRFQVFRRTSVEDPFQIIVELNFDKTILPYSSGERIPESIVERSNGPVKNYLDSDFNDIDSDYIYAICAIDAHGLSSAYSEQFRVRFDKITGKLLITRVSTEGAPKPYPNVNITEDFFSDLIKDSGHTRMRIFFDPEYADVTKDGESLSLISTSGTGATTYRLSMTELNIGKSQSVDITVETPSVTTDGIPVSIARLYTAS
jgi:hypothetical protein